jgi:hypothetical protein
MITAVIVIGVVGFILDRLMNLVEKNATLILSCPSLVMRLLQKLKSNPEASSPVGTQQSLGPQTVAAVLGKETSDAIA